MAKTRTTITLGKKEAEILLNMVSEGFDSMESRETYDYTRRGWRNGEEAATRRVVKKVGAAWRETHEEEQS